MREKYEKQEWMKEKASRETSRERSLTSLPRCISPDSDQNKLRKQYEEQEEEITKREKETKARRQELEKEKREIIRKEQAKLKEKFEEQ